MRNLTSEGQAKIAEIAQRYGASTDGVLTMLDALQRGGGTIAQFFQPSRFRRLRPMDAGRHDHGQRPLQQRAEGQGRWRLQ